MAATRITKAINERLSLGLEDMISSLVSEEIEKLVAHLLKRGVPKTDLEKYLGDFAREGSYVSDSRDVILVSSYSDSSHAMFGVLPPDFVTSVLKGKRSVRFNEKLTYGAGWLISKNVDDYSFERLKEDLTKSSIAFRESTMEEFSEVYTKPKTVHTRPLRQRINLTNKMEHKIHEETGFVVDTFTLNKSTVQLVIGTLRDTPLEQKNDEESSSQSSTVVPLTPDQIQECEKRGWIYLTKDILASVTNPIRYARYSRLLRL